MERPHEASQDVLLPPWLWTTYAVWSLVVGQWRAHGPHLLAIDLNAIHLAMGWCEIPSVERLEVVQRIQVIERHCLASLGK